TYQSKNFSLQYPSEATVGKNSDGDITIGYAEPEKPTKGLSFEEVSPGYGITMSEHDLEGRTVQQVLNDLFKGTTPVTPTRTLKIGGRTAYSFQGNSEIVFDNDYVQ